MSRPALATIDDLAVLLGSSPGDAAQANARLAQASEIVRAYAGATWLNEDGSAVEGVPGQIPGVVAGMVERAARNPGGITQESAGPFAVSFGPEAAQRLYLTQWEKAIIRAAVGRSEIGVLSTTRGSIETGLIATGGQYPEETLEGLHELMGGS